MKKHDKPLKKERLSLIFKITDISPVAGLTALTWLNLNNDQIIDINPVAGLTALTELHLDDNQITDISPLVENRGIGDDDIVFVTDNPLDCVEQESNIQKLLDRYVELYTDCN